MKSTELEALLHAHQRDVERYLRYLGADPADLEDLLQECFVAAFHAKNVPPLEQTARVGAWLRVIARNLLFREWRRRGRRPVLLDEEAWMRAEAVWCEETADTGGSDTLLEALRHCADSISERNRAMLREQTVDRVSREELSRRYGLTPDGVKTTLRRTRDQLRECIRRRIGASFVLTAQRGDRA